MQNHFDLIIIGAGASGMMCAGVAGKAGLSVLLIDHAKKIGEKIRISGGGKANFTNRKIDGYHYEGGSKFYISENPYFVRNAFAHYNANNFIALIEHYQIPYEERNHEQLFCKNSAKDLIALLKNECKEGNVSWLTEAKIESISDLPHFAFKIQTDKGLYSADRLIIATGALALPDVGATGFGFEIAKQYQHMIIPPKAALVPLQFEKWKEERFDCLAGISLPVKISTRNKKSEISFKEALLFCHKGLSAPAILQISSYWEPGNPIFIDLIPNTNLSDKLTMGKKGEKIGLLRALSHLAPTLPNRLIEHFLSHPSFEQYKKHPWADIPDQILKALGEKLNHWELLPSGHDGHRKAEATRGGVSTRELNPKTMESKLRKHLYFIGEVVDITGWLGGYNFQWAWSSAQLAAHSIIEQAKKSN